MSWTYDEQADVLYISTNKAQPALSTDIGEGVLLRYGEDESAVTGLTITGLRSRLKAAKLVPKGDECNGDSTRYDGDSVPCVIAMPVGTLNIPKFEKNQTGKVTATITVSNDVDQILADRGFIRAEEVRSITLENVLVDTGASMLSLPTALAEKLGLSVKGVTSLTTAAGIVEARIFSHALLEINGRSSTFDCMALTEIEVPLLGVLPMETLGIEPDLKNQRLRMLGTGDGESYIYAM